MTSPVPFAPVLTVSAWVDPVVDDLGFDPTSSYVEYLWLPRTGPSATWCYRRLTAGLRPDGDAYQLERRVRYFKVGKLLRFRPADLDALVEAGRRDPVSPWVHTRSPQRSGVGRNTAQRRLQADAPNSASDQQGTSAGA